jgi:putative tricarboxylic transport membrane protein
MLLNAGLVVAGLVLFIALVGALGFFVTSSALLLVLFLAFGVRPLHAVPIAIVVPVIVHYVFYTVLRVPLPWGVLEGVAW